MKLTVLLALLLCPGLCCPPPATLAAQENKTMLPIRDLASLEGVRENPLVGYGIVVGLNRTGDSQQTIFSVQTLANVLQKMGVQIPAASLSAVTVKNVAAVLLTASLPPFARPGTQIDITVSSIGDAKSLEGGTLLLAPLYAADGKVYAEAQGAVTLGGYTAGRSGANSKQVNHPTAGRVPNGATGGARHRAGFAQAEPDFAAGTRSRFPAHHGNGRGHQSGSRASYGHRGRQRAGRTANIPVEGISELMARLLSLKVEIHPRARVVVSERTGTIVMGRDVRLSAVSILHGDLSIEISTDYQVSQPAPFGNGQTAVVPETKVEAKDDKTKRIELGEGASVEQLVNGLQAIGATARDVVAILQAIKAAGAWKPIWR